MKKIVYSVAAVCILSALISCKSTKAEKKSGKKGKAAVETEVLADEDNSFEDSDENEENTSEKEELENADFTGWIKSAKKNINERYGKIQIKIKSKKGTFTLAALNEEGKAIPVLSTSNEYVSNAVYLKTSKKIYNLVTDNSVRKGARRTTDGAVILYEIPSVAQINYYFSFFASEKNKDIDMAKVTLSVKNISDRSDEFALKTIFDTVLGESGNYHFYNSEGVPVKSEVLFRTLQNQKWFVSKNMNASMQFFFTGADCTVPEMLALGNYSTLEKNSWEPDMLTYRAFDTVLSYNNSAVCSIWKSVKLAPSEMGSVVFYMAFSGNELPAAGEKYIYNKDYFASDEKADKDNSKNEPVVITPYTVKDTPEEKEVAAPLPQAADIKKPADVTVPETPAADSPFNNLTKEQLSPDYIQSLLDRIAALEEDTDSISRQELLQLNAELDAILNYLRQ